MTKISLENLKAEVADDQRREAERRVQSALDYKERQRLSLECSLAGVVTLALLARLSARIEGMPSTVELAASNGYLRGFRGVREDGIWRLDPPSDGLHYMSFDNADSSRVLQKAAAACGITWNASASERFAGIVAVNSPDDFADAWAECGAIVPRHSRVAAMVFGGPIGKAFGLSVDPMLSKQGLLAIEGEGLDPYEPLPDGYGPAILRVKTGYGGASVVDRILEAFPLPRGSDISGRLVHLFAAARDSMGLEKLNRHGADFSWKDEAGFNALHAACQSVGRSPVMTHGVVATLLRAGVDPDGVDCHGRTPGSIVESEFESSRKEDSFDESDYGHYVAIARMLGVELEVVDTFRNGW